MSETLTAGPRQKAAGARLDAPTGSRPADDGGWSTAVGPAPLRSAVLLASALLAVAVPAVAALNVSFPGRAVLALLFTLAVPGIPVVALLRIPHPLVEASLAGAVSIAFALLTSTAAITAHWWNPLAWMVGTAAAHLLATGFALTRPASAGRSGRELRSRARMGAARLTGRWVAVALLAGAAALWTLAVRSVDLGATGATGLIAVVGWQYVAALVLVAVVAAWQLLRRRLDEWVLAATAVVLTLVIYAFVNVAEGEGSVATGWLHVGFARYISEHHVSFNGLDARGSWPGFFAATAQFVQLAGVPDGSSFLVWAPFVYNAAAIVPLLVIARSITRSRRTAWLAVFVYLGFNWYEQDYYSPQATAFLLYLVILATLFWAASITRLPVDRGPLLRRWAGAWRRRPGLPAGMSAAQSLAMEAVLFVVAAAVVVAHQLTPVYLVLTLLLFTLTGRTRHRRLWLLVALLLLVWFSYGATDFWAGHLRTVFGDLGQLGANLNQGVASRVTGDPTYQKMQDLRVGYSLALVILAFIGLWRIRRRSDALLLALLPAAAGLLVALQSYGGEVVLRIFVYASPVLAPLAAIALRGFVRAHRRSPALGARPGRGGHSLVQPRVAVASAGLLVLVTAFGLLGTATRGVNTSFERVTKDDVAAAQALWAHVRHGDTVGYLAPAGAYNGDRVGDWTVVNLDPDACDAVPFVCATAIEPRFILVSKTQDAEEALVARSSFTSTGLAEDLVRHGLYRYVYKGPEAALLVHVGQGG